MIQAILATYLSTASSPRIPNPTGLAAAAPPVTSPPPALLRLDDQHGSPGSTPLQSSPWWWLSFAAVAAKPPLHPMAEAPPPQRPQQGVAARTGAQRHQQPPAPPPRPKLQTGSTHLQPPTTATMVGAALGQGVPAPFFPDGSSTGMGMSPPPSMQLQRPSCSMGHLRT